MEFATAFALGAGQPLHTSDTLFDARQRQPMARPPAHVALRRPNGRLATLDVVGILCFQGLSRTPGAHRQCASGERDGPQRL